jgi:acetoin utilization deacetylase AcuC-like enzyme
MGFAHPESPDRLAVIYEMLENPLMSWKFTEIEPREATHKEIEAIHAPSYVDFIASTAGKRSVFLDPDTSTSPQTYETAKLAVGGVLNAIDSVMEGEVDNAFALVRPPGHHAEKDTAAGFCVFNNIAIGAMHAISKYNLKRILIVDWDLHHGNGTQHSFYGDHRVLYFSTHQYPYYPGTGSLTENGRGQGEYYTINVPLTVGIGDPGFVKIFRKILQPVALEFNPELILLSAGFDTYFQDPLGGMQVTPDGYAAMTRVLLDTAEACCKGRFVAVLEGGYHLGGLVKCVKAVLEEMLDETHFSDERLALLEKEVHEGINQLIINKVIARINPYWKVF